MDHEVRETFWKAMSGSPFVMLRLEGSNEHAEPMTAQLDRDAHHEIWFYCARDNRVAGGGRAMGQFVSKGHEVFACLAGTLVEETDRARFEKHWDNTVEAWFPNGKSDPKIMMLRFDIDDAEIWTSDLGAKGRLKLLTGSKIRPGEAGKHEVGLV